MTSRTQENVQLYKEFLAYLQERKSYWLAPLIFVILMFATLAFFLEGSVLAPAIYSIFWGWLAGMVVSSDVGIVLRRFLRRKGDFYSRLHIWRGPRTYSALGVAWWVRAAHRVVELSEFKDATRGVSWQIRAHLSENVPLDRWTEVVPGRS